MQIFFIEKSDNPKLFHKILKKIEVIEDKIILNQKIENQKINQKIKTVKNIKEILNKYNVDKVIISSNLKEDKDFINILQSNNINIVSGKKLFKQLIYKILKNNCKNIEEQQISIVTNTANRETYNIIKKLSKKFKTMNIITNNINDFQKIKQELWDKEGIIIWVTNNKKKALAKSNVIINFDFPEEILNQYTIYDKSTIINLEENIKIKKKRFCGKIINDYEIRLKPDTNIHKCLKDKKYKNFDIKDLVEIYLINEPEEIENILV